MEAFVKIFLPIYIVLLLLITYVINVYKFKRKYGTDPRVVKKNDPIMHVLKLYITGIYLATLMIIFIYSFLPQWYEYFMPIKYLDHDTIQIIGMIFLVIGLIVVRTAQVQLKGSYRIGIDRSDKKVDLITGGLYSRSRNPISFGLFLITVCMFLVIPNLITFTLSNLSWFLINIRVITEEQHLEKQFGNSYLKYKNNTPKWL